MNRARGGAALRHGGRGCGSLVSLGWGAFAPGPRPRPLRGLGKRVCVFVRVRSPAANPPSRGSKWARGGAPRKPARLWDRGLSAGRGGAAKCMCG